MVAGSMPSLFMSRLSRKALIMFIKLADIFSVSFGSIGINHGGWRIRCSLFSHYGSFLTA